MSAFAQYVSLIVCSNIFPKVLLTNKGIIVFFILLTFFGMVNGQPLYPTSFKNKSDPALKSGTLTLVRRKQ